jgi:amidase
LSLERATIPQLGAAMRSGRISSAGLTALYLRRIRRYDGTLRAVVAVNPRALAEARLSDRRLRAGQARGLLEGIPVLVKDNVETVGAMGVTAGSFALRGARPAQDATLVARLRSRGAVILGKANLTEWANSAPRTCPADGARCAGRT